MYEKDYLCQFAWTNIWTDIFILIKLYCFVIGVEHSWSKIRSEILMLLRQLSYAMKNQLKAPKASYIWDKISLTWGVFFAYRWFFMALGRLPLCMEATYLAITIHQNAQNNPQWKGHFACLEVCCYGTYVPWRQHSKVKPMRVLHSVCHQMKQSWLLLGRELQGEFKKM